MRTWAAVLQTIIDAVRPTPLSHVMTSYDVYQAGPGDGGPRTRDVLPAFIGAGQLVQH